MKYAAWRLLLVLLLWGWLPLARAQNDDGGGQPLVCTGNATYFPRGDKWVLKPGTSVVYQFQKDGPSNQAAPQNIPASVAKSAVNQGIGYWSGVRCSSPPQSLPSVAWSEGADYATRDNGDNPTTGVYQNIIYWVIDANAWLADSTTVAVTTNTFFPETGFMLGADVAFNGVNFVWQATDSTGAQYGCNLTNPNCYDIASVMAHEFGHFNGFLHVACSNAVLQPITSNSFTVSGLSSNETAGLCALYPPATAGSQVSSLGQQCSSNSNCQSGLTCLLPTGVASNAPYGMCGSTCNTTNDCPDAYACEAVGGYGNFCIPGLHLPGVTPTTATAVGDLCGPCSDGAQCDSGICGVISASGNGICTQNCAAPNYACPTGFACSSTGGSINLCWPIDPSLCDSTYTGQPLNDTCLQAANSTDPNSAVNASCQSGLTCFSFSSGVGSCVPQCSAIDTTQSCPAGYTCCYGIDSNGHCITTPQSSVSGGCFEVTHVGDACVLPTESVCDATTACIYTSAPSAAGCYHLCPNGTCSDFSETCVSTSDANGDSIGLCCQSSTYNGDIASCVPNPGPCPRNTGVACNIDNDCISNICLKYANGAACSIACNSDSDCPGINDDANGDGSPDGGAACLPINGSTLCWPNKGPISPPACATVSSSGSSAKGCSCNTLHGDEFSVWGALGGCSWALLRRSHRRVAKLRQA